jgi:hypothetical protein
VSLLEVADYAHASIFDLGKVFKKVVETLHIRLDEVDPSVFLERALSQLLPNNPDLSRSLLHQVMYNINPH